MKAKEIRELSAEEIEQRIKDETEELGNIRFQHAIAALPNPSLIRQKRRLIARLRTLLQEKQAETA